jgi:hypothetical protein
VLGARRDDEATTQYSRDCRVNNVQPLSSVEKDCHAAEFTVKFFLCLEEGRALHLVANF